jgi:hypothetical protein
MYVRYIAHIHTGTIHDNLQSFCLEFEDDPKPRMLDLYRRPPDASDFALAANGCFPGRNATSGNKGLPSRRWPKDGSNSGQRMIQVTGGKKSVNRQALDDLKQQIPLLGYLQAHDWRPARPLSRGPGGWGCVRCMKIANPASWWIPTKTSSTATAVAAAVT